MDQDSSQHLSAVWMRYTSIVAERGEGVYLHSTDGRTYLDFTSGIGVTNTGHCHPKVVAAAKQQIDRLIHGQVNVLYHQPLFDLVAELLTIMPPGLNSFFFSNSGAEAVEAAVKLARQATRRPNIISFRGAFHGRTMGALSLTTSSANYRAGYQPLMGGVCIAPYPYAYQYGWTEEKTSAFCLEEIRSILATETAPGDTAAVLVEPVLGEGGYVPSPPGFLQGLRQICDEHGILLLVDEVQSGFGRTGRWFACQHYEVTPDILILAKAMASGFPLSCIAAHKSVMDAWLPGAHGGTFGGNAVSCAAAVATIQVIREEGLVENSARQGEYLLNRLRELQRQHPSIGDIRGLGLMVATEFTTPDGQPDDKTCRAVWSRCLERNLMLLMCGTSHNIIRWVPPLIVDRATVDQAVDIFEAALNDIKA